MSDPLGPPPSRDALLMAIRWLAYDPTLDPADACRRIRDLFHDYEHGDDDA
jgi:hypothetical protein